MSSDLLIRGFDLKKLLDKKFIFLFLIIFAALSRLVCLGVLPAGINQDEAMLSMDALAFSRYGTDRFGMWLPLHLTGWGESQMSALLGYIMVPFIKVFGFSSFSIRLPMALISIVSVVIIYFVAKELFDERMGLLVMFLTVINPWHFIQSRWSIDCNLFPHVFLIAFLLLLKGLKNKKALFASMIFFGLTFYCYGIAIYTVPVFLFVFALWCLVKKQLRITDVLISVIVFLVVAGPEIIIMAINLFKHPSIETPLFTLPFFPASVRSNDILFLNYSFSQLGKNALAMIKCVFIQTPDYIFNTIPFFGPLYHISIPFMIIGIVSVVKRFFTAKEEDMHDKAKSLALLGFLLSGIWVGLITFEVNVNRINIIYYPLIILTAVGIETVARSAKLRGGVIVVYAAFAIAFFISYCTYYKEEIKPWFSVHFLEMVEKADEESFRDPEGYDRLYITSAMETQTNVKMSEILTQYALRIDSKYFLEETDLLNGREVLPYSDRFHFVDMTTADLSQPGLYVIKKTEQGTIPDGMVILDDNGVYILASMP
jgi:4-amino-4-deoxy-L-arabinose transferase-like glycosyltransferase